MEAAEVSTEWIVLHGAPGVETSLEGGWLRRSDAQIEDNKLKVSGCEVAVPLQRFERHPEGGPIAQVWEVHRSGGTVEPPMFPVPRMDYGPQRRTRHKRAQRKRQAERREALVAQLESENHRLRLLASSALERTQVGDADEATALLEQVVTLNGRYVPRSSA